MANMENELVKDICIYAGSVSACSTIKTTLEVSASNFGLDLYFMNEGDAAFIFVKVDVNNEKKAQTIIITLLMENLLKNDNSRTVNNR